MTEWYRGAMQVRADPTASIELAKRFVAAPAEERAEVLRIWDPLLVWSLPNPWRLACRAEAPGSIADRIRTALLFQALSGLDPREMVMGLAVIHHSCAFAGLDPRAAFEEVARALGGAPAMALREIDDRAPEHRSMRAFRLTAIEDPSGGFEIRAAW